MPCNLPGCLKVGLDPVAIHAGGFAVYWYGLFIATGHFRNGILLAPITARLLTEWVTGKARSLEVPDFLPDRFIRRRQG